MIMNIVKLSCNPGTPSRSIRCHAIFLPAALQSICQLFFNLVQQREKLIYFLSLQSRYLHFKNYYFLMVSDPLLRRADDVLCSKRSSLLSVRQRKKRRDDRAIDSRQPRQLQENIQIYVQIYVYVGIYPQYTKWCVDGKCFCKLSPVGQNSSGHPSIFGGCQKLEGRLLA